MQPPTMCISVPRRRPLLGREPGSARRSSGSPSIAEIGAKRAEDAAVHADVRGVQVRVDVVVADVAVLPLADEVGQLAEFVEMDFRLVEEDAVVEGEAFAGFDFGADGFEVGGMLVVSCQLFRCQLLVFYLPIARSRAPIANRPRLTMALTLKKARFTRLSRRPAPAMFGRSTKAATATSPAPRSN